MNLSQFDVLAIFMICVAVMYVANAWRITRVAQVQADVAREEALKVRLQCRAENIKAAGWPPYYLDADGDKHSESYDDNDVLLFKAGVHPMQTVIAEAAR